jgi:hypothetical protein
LTKSWKEIADAYRHSANAQISRANAAYDLLGRAVHRAFADEAIEQAKTIARELRKEDGLNAHRMCFPSKPTGVTEDSIQHKLRFVSLDRVAVHADVLLSMEAELAEALAALHSARELLAKTRTGDLDLVINVLETNKAGYENVSEGRAWGQSE